MKIQWIGTAAAEGWPAVFCQCEACRKAHDTGFPPEEALELIRNATRPRTAEYSILDKLRKCGMMVK